MRIKGKTLWGLVSAAMVTGLIVAACGGGEPTSTPRPTSAPAAATATSVPAGATNTPAAPDATARPIPTPTRVPTSTPPPAGPEPKRGGEFRMRVSGDFAFEWDAYTARGQFAVIIIQNLLNNLTHLDAVSTTIQPDLAESFTVSSDGRKITYKVRNDVTWHDGRRFTADDVRYSFERALNPPSTGASVYVNRFAAISDIAAPDDETVIVTLSRPSASLLTVISSPGFLIYPEHIPDIDEWKADPVGTGPFQFVQARFGVDADLDANPNYFKTDQAGRQLPFLGSVKHLKLSQEVAIAAFRVGDLSCACGYSSDILESQVDDVRRDVPDVLIGSTWSVNTIYMNSKPPLDDKRVRQAIQIGVDRVKMLAIIRGGRAHYPPTYYLPSGLGGVWSLPDDEILKLPGFREPKQVDLDESARLFAEAGVDPGDITLKFLGSQVQGDLAEALVQLLIDIGVNVDADLTDNVQRTEQLLRGDFDLSFTGGGRTFDDAADQMTNYTKSTGTLNYGKFNNPRIDELLDAQEREIDAVKRAELINELQLEQLDWAMFFPLHTFPTAFAIRPFVKNLALDRAFVVSNAHRLERVWFDL